MNTQYDNLHTSRPFGPHYSLFTILCAPLPHQFDYDCCGIQLDERPHYQEHTDEHRSNSFQEGLAATKIEHGIG